MANTYDFYKPKLDSEYPEVDGPLSITTYLTALDQTYKTFREKSKRRAAAYSQANGHANGNGATNGANGNGHANGKSVSEEDKPFSLEEVDYPIFHSPYGKMVQKAHARLVYNDFLANPDAPRYANVPERETWLAQSHKASLTDKNLEKAFMAFAKADFESTVEKGMRCARRCGNMYTASLYGCLSSLIAAVPPTELHGRRLSMFAYGSGIASSFFVLRVKGDTSEMREKLDLQRRLAAIKVVPCQEYVDALKLREGNHNAAGYTPEGSLDDIWPGGYYLEHVDSKYRRKYGRKPVDAA